MCLSMDERKQNVVDTYDGILVLKQKKILTHAVFKIHMNES